MAKKTRPRLVAAGSPMLQGAYPARRASALSGVPLSTVRYWARTDLVVPSVSPVKVMLWSYADLMALRTICWLRRDKTQDDGVDIPASTMPAVRRAVRELRALDLATWTDDAGSRIVVTLDGVVAIKDAVETRRPSGQRLLPEINVIEPFNCGSACGPDLYQPKEHVRIVPAKISGAPHIRGTRIPTETIAALAAQGVGVATILSFYPTAEEWGVRQAIEFEDELARNLQHAA